MLTKCRRTSIGTSPNARQTHVLSGYLARHPSAFQRMLKFRLSRQVLCRDAGLEEKKKQFKMLKASSRDRTLYGISCIHSIIQMAIAVVCVCPSSVCRADTVSKRLNISHIFHQYLVNSISVVFSELETIVT